VETKVWEKDGAEMVRVAGGSLEMGASSGEAAEKPVHAVSIPTFWIDRTEVTNEQYKRFIDATGRPVPYVAEPWAAPYNWDRAARTYPDGQGDMPVVLVSWDDAAAYARWAGKRLPTEAEWEYAARGAQGKKFPWGDSWNAALCNSLGSDPFDATPAPVGSFPKGASWCGAMDMAGNVWEWVADWYSPEYYSASPSKDPAGPATGRYRAIRGGSWGSPSDLCRSYARGFRPPYARSDAAGFRCAADPSS
jgi:formylglycine-generating enzyme required for sulfatase activity